MDTKRRYLGYIEDTWSVGKSLRDHSTGDILCLDFNSGRDLVFFAFNCSSVPE
jgi:hypothetical protein